MQHAELFILQMSVTSSFGPSLTAAAAAGSVKALQGPRPQLPLSLLLRRPPPLTVVPSVMAVLVVMVVVLLLVLLRGGGLFRKFRKNATLLVLSRLALLCE